jgi:hypothetical protein
VLDPDDLLGLARSLAGAVPSAAAGAAAYRRSVSTAYYALFHAVLRTGADRFFGAAQRDAPGYAVIYRGFAHARMKDVCREIDKPVLREAYQDQLGRRAVGAALREFATVFGKLQDLRSLADYHPQSTIGRLDAERACDAAAYGRAMLAAADPAELCDVLALMLATQRK